MKKLFFVFVATTCASVLFAQGSLQVTSGAHIKSSGGAYLVLENIHIANNGSLQQTAGSGFVKLTGATNVHISGTSATTIDALLLSKSSGATVSLNSDLAVVTSVNFSGGFLNLDNNILNLGSTGVLMNETETSRAYTNGSGYIETSAIINSPVPVTPGNLGATITTSANMGNTIIRRGHAIQTGIFGSNNSIRRYYDIIPDININLKAVLRFHYFDAELNSIPEGSLYQWKTRDNVNWDFVGADARDMVTNYVEKKSINKFDRWTLATATSPSIICPANIIVSANQNGCKALVSFAASATGIPSPAIVYRVGNKIITSPAVFPRGTTTVIATASNGLSPDAECAFTVTVVCGPVSPVAHVSEPQKESETLSSGLDVTVFPNPSSNYYSLNVRSDLNERILMQVMDVNGRIIETRNVNAGTIARFGENYKSGTYVVRIIQGHKSKELKLVKLD